jgi:iron-sulfur cluster repair protein YtfE (RIC family)
MTRPLMPRPFEHVTAASTVNDVLGQNPATAPIFHLLGLDTCCRGQMRLCDAAADARTNLGVLLSMLETSISASFVAPGSQ